MGDPFRVWGTLAAGHDETAPSSYTARTAPLTARDGLASTSSYEQKHTREMRHPRPAGLPVPWGAHRVLSWQEGHCAFVAVMGEEGSTLRTELSRGRGEPPVSFSQGRAGGSPGTPGDRASAEGQGPLAEPLPRGLGALQAPAARAAFPAGQRGRSATRHPRGPCSRL